MDLRRLNVARHAIRDRLLDVLGIASEHRLLICVLSHTLFGDAFHDFVDVVPDLRDENVDDLLDDTIGNSFLHIPTSLRNSWTWHRNNLLHCAI